MGVLPVMILIRKRLILYSGLFCCFLAGMAAVLWAGQDSLVPAYAPGDDEPPVIVVVDPGHGGEDGGAVSTDGSVQESGLNLEVAQKVCDLLRFTGQQAAMTRTEDVSIHSPDAKTMRQRKVSDIHNRVALVNETERAVLLSIHQNSLPSSRVTHGAQVFWNTREGAEPLAEAVQQALNASVNVGNEKHTKKIPSTIYLMNQITAPGILVECGFLSNWEETVRLQEPTYQRKLATAITAGYCVAGKELS